MKILAALIVKNIFSCPELLSFSQGEVRFLDQNALQSHGVAAALPGLEKITIAVPLPIFKRDLVGVVLPLECNRKRIDLDPFPFGSVLFRFLNFPNHAGIHHIHLPGKK